MRIENEIIPPIKPVSVKIYMEDNVSYLDYVGEALNSRGEKIKIHIPR